MSYGSSSYGSAAIGGSASSGWFTFLAFLLRDSGTYDAEASISATTQFFSLFLRKASENTGVTAEAFTRNGPDDTPQSQGTFAGLYAQHVIPAAPFVSVRVTIDQEGGEFVEVRGRAGD